MVFLVNEIGIAFTFQRLDCWDCLKTRTMSFCYTSQLKCVFQLDENVSRFRVLTHTSYDADANQLLKELGWDNLETRRQKLKAEMVYKSVNGLALNYLSSKFIQRNDAITSYNLRDSDGKLAIPLPRTSTTIALATYRGSKLTNSLRKHWTTLVWTDGATWNRGKFVSQPAPSKRFLYIFFHFWGGRYNKTLNDWSSGVLFPLALNDVEGLGETKLTVSLGASH